MPLGKLSVYNSPDSTDTYIIHYEKSMVGPELTPNGYIENQGITASRELLPTINDMGPNTGRSVQNKVNEQGKTALQQDKMPTSDQISKGTYYEDIAKAKRSAQDEIYSVINESNHYSYAPVAPKRINTPSKFLRLADTNETVKKASLLYGAAFDEIYRMLNGQDSLNLKRAVFVVENAYYGQYT